MKSKEMLERSPGCDKGELCNRAQLAIAEPQAAVDASTTQENSTGRGSRSAPTSFWAVLLLWMLPALGVLSQGLPNPFLLKDINQTRSGGYITEFKLLGTNIIFTAYQESSGYELWKSDGTVLGTALLKDICSGPASSTPSQFFDCNGALLFIAHDDTNGTELWRTDGTSGGTYMVKNISPGAADSSFYGFLPFQGGFLFVVYNSAGGGQELWKTDGTSSGTLLVKAIDTWDFSPGSVVVLGGMVLFKAYDPTHGYELWKTDGTAAGTTLVKDIHPSGDSYPSGFTVLSNAVYFSADDGSNGRELWRTDGTSGGTYMVKDIYDGPSSSSPASFTVMNGKLYFSAQNDVFGRELWKSDGTSAGTGPVKDINPVVDASLPYLGTFSSSPNNLTVANNAIFFQADDGSNGVELWKSDGTAGGTVMVKNIAPTNTSSYPSQLVYSNSKLFFTAANGTNGNELWVTDGTAAGTQMLRDIYTGSYGSSPSYLTLLNSTTLLFTAGSDVYGNELWKTDGTTNGTALVRDIYSGLASSYPDALIATNGKAYFIAQDATGYAVMKTDGTNANTVPVALVPSEVTRDSSPYNALVISNTVFFVADDGTNGAELWKSDGTAIGTVLVKDIQPGVNASYPQELLNGNGTLFFTAQTDAAGRELWKSDGTTAGTTMVADLYSGAVGSSPGNFMVFRDSLCFQADNSSDDNELYNFKFSNGSLKPRPLFQNYPAGFVNCPVKLNQYVLFAQVLYYTDGSRYWIEFFRYDPATEALSSFATIDYNNGVYPNINWSANVNGRVFYSLSEGFSGQELWATDGFNSMVRLGDLNPGAASSYPTIPVFANGLYYFQAYTTNQGYELYVTDGTNPSSTRLMKDIRPGLSSSSPANMTNLNGILYFTANNGTNGTELWRSDGSTNGTYMVKDVYPGATSSSPHNLMVLNGRLLFGAYGLSGYEAWAFDPAVGQAYKLANNSYYSSATVVGNEVFFKGSDAYLWKSDGTTNGTLQVSASPWNPTPLCDFNGSLFFEAYGANVGYEPWLRAPDYLPGALEIAPTNVIAVSATNEPAISPGNESGYCWDRVSDPNHPKLYWESPGTYQMTWKLPGGGNYVTYVHVSELPEVSLAVGDKVEPPTTVNVTNQLVSPFESESAGYWHVKTHTAYATVPGRTTLRWGSSCPHVTQRINAEWPADLARYQPHVAGSQTNSLANWGAATTASVLYSEAGVDGGLVQSSRIFSASEAGRSLLLLAPGVPAQTNIYFQFVLSRAWYDTNILTEAGAIIGQEIVPALGWHNTNYGGPFALNVQSRYCVASNYYDRTTRKGPIIPVNRDRKGSTVDDMVVVYYQQGTNLYDPAARQSISSSLGWPCKPVRYDCQWPAAAPKIVIASGKGTGPLSDAYHIYYQNDPNQPGFNPNDEHALWRQAKGRLPELRVSARRVQVVEGSLASMSQTNGLVISNRLSVVSGSAAEVEVSVFFPSDQLPVEDVRLSVAPARGNASNVFASFASEQIALDTTISTNNWSSPKTLYFGALSSTNGLNSSNRFFIYVSGGLFAQQEIVVDAVATNQLALVLGATDLTVPEGSSRGLSIRLTRPPPGSVNVQMSRRAGDSDLSVVSSMPLTFTPSNWAVPQIVTLAAAHDADSENGVATNAVVASGALVFTNIVTATEQDDDLPGNAVFALRCDLGDLPGTANPQLSEPYVLLTYTNAQGQPLIAMYQVVAEEGSYVFRYEGKAGRQIQPPYPLSDFLNWQTNSYYSSGPGWQDRRSNIWARAAGNDGGATNIITKYFYPTYADPSFYIPAGYAVKANGWAPWLDRRPGGSNTIPTDVTNVITWPDNTPELRVGESLVKAKFGLPNIRGQTSVDILYEQTQALGLGSNSSAKVIDIGEVATTEYSAALPAGLPEDTAGQTVTNLLTGDIYFTTLPPHLRSRVWVNGDATRLKFKGQFVPEFGLEEPVGYLLLNVLSSREMSYLLDLSANPGFRTALTNLAVQAAAVRAPVPTTKTDNLALTAGLARGSGYVTLAFNNVVDPTRGLPAGRGTPVSLEIIRVTCPNYCGDVKVIYPPDPFNEDVTLRHSGDFAGVGGGYLFRWQEHEGPGKPATNALTWNYLTSVHGELGGLDQLVRAAGRRSLADWWYRCQWRSTNASHPCGTNWSAWTEPALTEGWIKRVLGSINFFNQKYTNLVNSPVDTVVSVIRQAGARWVGSTPLNAEKAVDFGLIEIYETVLKRGIEMSIEGTPAIDDAGANLALLQAAAQLANIYMLLGNEAYADAADPTIGFVGPVGLAEVPATSVHCFMDQVGSLLDEELALLRGLDDSDGRNVRYHPLYNRLPPNMFSGAQAEPAYVLNYDITDVTPPTGIDALDAQKIWPQGHGDAWGHYVMASKNFYRLLQNSHFTWSNTVEFVNLAGGLGTVPVNYQHERKFAQVAAAKARTGAEIINLTYRSRYVEEPSVQRQAFSDSNTNRAWGVGDWASRAGQGALFDWVVGNALLPPTSPGTGLAKVDRTTVAELREIVGSFVDIQEQSDRADAGLNPLGLAKNVVPFDINPNEIDAGSAAKTHFEQIYDRALVAMANAVGVFNNANASAQKLREQAQDLQKFQDTVDDREADFNNRLIEVFGYPYAEDPAGNPNGPDLFHYMYDDYSEITGEVSPSAQQFQVAIVDLAPDANGVISQVTNLVTYHLAANGLGMVKPSYWTRRRAPGEVQMAHSELLQTTARFKRALKEYDNLLAQIDEQAGLLQAQYRVNAGEINILNTGSGVQESLNTAIRRARDRQLDFQTKGRIANLVANAFAESLPKEMGWSFDPSSSLRGCILLAGSITTEIMTQNANSESMAELDHQQAKEMAQSQQNIQLRVSQQDLAIQQQVAQLQQFVRQEALSRLEIYNQQEAIQQSSGHYASTLAKGQRLLEDRLRFRQQTARNVQSYRYKDMAFRIFRNENIQRYRAQFDLAARFVYQAASAYDYETNLRDASQSPSDQRVAGDTLLTDIVRARSIGVFNGTTPSAGPGPGKKGDGGLAASLWAMKNSWDNYIKTPLGFNNADNQTVTFSLSAALFRANTNTQGSATWRAWLSKCTVPNILDLPEFQRYCKPPGSGLLSVEPGIVIPFSSSVHFGLNFFGWPEVGGGGNFNSSHFATKIRSVRVKFSGYDSAFGGLSPTPYVYLIPVGNDVLRAPISLGVSGTVPTREWKILDQFFPPPISLTSANTNVWQTANWLPFESVDTTAYKPDDYASQTPIRRYALMPADHDSLNNPENNGGFSRLIGRSVWNTRWLLVIPAGALRSDRAQALSIFIDGRYGDGAGVQDILLTMKVYSVSGN